MKIYINDFEIEKQNEYIDRLNYELDQIEAMGFSSYFLIVYDFIKWSKIMMCQLAQEEALEQVH